MTDLNFFDVINTEREKEKNLPNNGIPVTAPDLSKDLEAQENAISSNLQNRETATTDNEINPYTRTENIIGDPLVNEPLDSENPLAFKAKQARDYKDSDYQIRTNIRKSTNNFLYDRLNSAINQGISLPEVPAILEDSNLDHGLYLSVLEEYEQRVVVAFEKNPEFNGMYAMDYIRSLYGGPDWLNEAVTQSASVPETVGAIRGGVMQFYKDKLRPHLPMDISASLSSLANKIYMFAFASPEEQMGLTEEIDFVGLAGAMGVFWGARGGYGFARGRDNRVNRNARPLRGKYITGDPPAQILNLRKAYNKEGDAVYSTYSPWRLDKEIMRKINNYMNNADRRGVPRRDQEDFIMRAATESMKKQTPEASIINEISLDVNAGRMELAQRKVDALYGGVPINFLSEDENIIYNSLGKSGIPEEMWGEFNISGFINDGVTLNRSVVNGILNNEKSWTDFEKNYDRIRKEFGFGQEVDDEGLVPGSDGVIESATKQHTRTDAASLAGVQSGTTAKQSPAQRIRELSERSAKGELTSEEAAELRKRRYQYYNLVVSAYNKVFRGNEKEYLSFSLGGEVRLKRTVVPYRTNQIEDWVTNTGITLEGLEDEALSTTITRLRHINAIADSQASIYSSLKGIQPEGKSDLTFQSFVPMATIVGVHLNSGRIYYDASKLYHQPYYQASYELKKKTKGSTEPMNLLKLRGLRGELDNSPNPLLEKYLKTARGSLDREYHELKFSGVSMDYSKNFVPHGISRDKIRKYFGERGLRNNLNPLRPGKSPDEIISGLANIFVEKLDWDVINKNLAKDGKRAVLGADQVPFLERFFTSFMDPVFRNREIQRNSIKYAEEVGHQILVFKSAEDHLQILEDFGEPNIDRLLDNSLNASMRKQANSYVMGYGSVDDNVNEYLRAIELVLNPDIKISDSLRTNSRYSRQIRTMLESGYNTLSGVGRYDKNALTKIGSGMMGVVKAAYLGYSSLATLADIPATIVTLMSKHDTSFATELKNLLDIPKRMSRKELRKEFTILHSNWHESNRVGEYGVFENFQQKGLKEAAINTMLTANGVHWLTNFNKNYVYQIEMNRIHGYRNKEFLQLPKFVRQDMTLAGITPKDWDLIRKVKPTLLTNGENFITPTGVLKELPDSIYHKYKGYLEGIVSGAVPESTLGLRSVSGGVVTTSGYGADAASYVLTLRGSALKGQAGFARNVSRFLQNSFYEQQSEDGSSSKRAFNYTKFGMSLSSALFAHTLMGIIIYHLGQLLKGKKPKPLHKWTSEDWWQVVTSSDMASTLGELGNLTHSEYRFMTTVMGANFGALTDSVFLGVNSYRVGRAYMTNGTDKQKDKAWADMIRSLNRTNPLGRYVFGGVAIQRLTVDRLPDLVMSNPESYYRDKYKNQDYWWHPEHAYPRF